MLPFEPLIVGIIILLFIGDSTTTASNSLSKDESASSYTLATVKQPSINDTKIIIISTSTLSSINESLIANKTCTKQSDCSPPSSTMTDQIITNTNAFKDLIRRWPMLPISIILISMFISICIILQLFAKARFRHTHSSIFADPQKLELAKAQERRLSQLSAQLSAAQTYSTGHNNDENPSNQRTSTSQIYLNGRQYRQQQSIPNHHLHPRLSLPQTPKYSSLQQQRPSIQSAIVPIIIPPPSTSTSISDNNSNSNNTLSNE